MPKRPCPFDNTYSPQSKIYVGTKQIENGVMKREKMKAVYDRTLSLLFSGAKNVQNNNAVDMMDTSASSLCTPATATHNTNLSQLVLTSCGTLTRPSGSSQNAHSQCKAVSACVGCQCVVPSHRPSCSYCECKLCDSCLRSCHFCGGSFCPKCSLTVYFQEEKVVCLSCC